MGNPNFLFAAVFRAKTIAFLASAFLLLTFTAQAQTDTVYQKPSLNNGMPPAEVTPPVIIVEPAKQKPAPDTTAEVKVKEEKEYKDITPFRDRFFTGGGFGLAFGDYTNVQLAPILGYQLTDWFAAGLGLTYIYEGNRFVSNNYLGKKVFIQGMVYKGFFGHVEYERFSLLGEKGNAEAILGGAGYRQMASNKVGVDLMVLLNLNQSAHSLYRDPFVYRFGLYIKI